MAKSAQTSLENRILEVAAELFLERGYDATSTTDIAKRVGCNQALVHYYFRTKENLFQRIFVDKVSLVLDETLMQGTQEMTFEDVLSHFIDGYFKMLTDNPKLPFFIINDLILKKERRATIKELLEKDSSKMRYHQFCDQLVKAEIEKGNIREIDILDLTLHVISLVVFTFLSLPLYCDFFDKKPEEISEYLEHRKEEIRKLLLNGLKKQA